VHAPVYSGIVASRDDRFHSLRSVYFFDSLTDEEVETLLDVCEEERVGAGGVVFAEGSAADKFYIVLDGTVQVWKSTGDGSVQMLAEHGQGYLFGEMALVDDLPRSASIRVKTPARLLSIRKADFQRIVAADAGIALSVLRSLSAMVRESNGSFVEALRRRNTELETLYEDLKRAQGELVRNERLAALGRFASLILHDIKNPLSIMRAYAELTLHGVGNAERVTESARTIIKEADRLGGLVNELLDYARGDIRLALSPVSLTGLVKGLLESLQQRFAASRIEVRTDVGYDGPVILDEARMLRVLHNLADNAIKAMPRGGTFSLTVARQGDIFHMRTSDTGVGMSEETMKRLFEPFFSSFEQGGTGLGMAIARSIVRAHRGELTAESERGKGTTFTIALPARF
jgi:signal transduction histidine kinase